jgi:hypothetical protein
MRVVSDAFAIPNQSNDLSHNARRTYEQYFTPDKNLHQLIDIYRGTIEDAQNYWPEIKHDS